MHVYTRDGQDSDGDELRIDDSDSDSKEAPDNDVLGQPTDSSMKKDEVKYKP